MIHEALYDETSLRSQRINSSPRSHLRIKLGPLFAAHVGYHHPIANETSSEPRFPWPMRHSMVRLPFQASSNFAPREMGGLKPVDPHPRAHQSAYSFYPSFCRGQLRSRSGHRSLFFQSHHRTHDHNFFQHGRDPSYLKMFHETKRGGNARVVRKSVDVPRTSAQRTGRKTRRRHSTLAEHTDHFGVLEVDVVYRRHLRDRKERKKERRYTSSAFDSTKNMAEPPQNGSPLSSDPNSSSSSMTYPPDKNAMALQVLGLALKQSKMPLDPFSRNLEGPQCPIWKGKQKSQHVDTCDADRTHYGKRLESASQSRPLFRITSNLEHSSKHVVYSECKNRISLDVHNLNKRPLEKNSTNPKPGPEKRLHSELASPRHADRERTSRDEGLRARISPRSPNQHHFTGRPTRNFASSGTKLNSAQRLPTGINVVKALSYDDQNDSASQPQLHKLGRRSNSSCSSASRSSGQLREDSNFSRLSAQSWMSIESEEALNEMEARIITSRTSRYSRKASGSSGRSVNHHEDHIPATLFGVDVDGNAVERISNEDPYCLSVLECCAIIQIGADISKKLSFNRYEQRRVWMSTDFLRLCWTSKKAGLYEDHIKLCQVAKIKLSDRTLWIEVIGGYGICFMFPSVTSAGLWVRALACLVPLQAQIKVPLGVTIASEKEREEFSLTEDKFAEKPIRDFMAVNNYVALCNPMSTPRNMGMKMAFSFSEERVYGLRYIPRHAIHHMLRTKKEIAVLKRLSHPNLLKYYEILEDPNFGGMYAVFEHLSRGCIADSSNLQRMQIYKEAHVRVILTQIVEALLYLHSVRITHADVRPENILMAPNGCAKLNPIGCIMHDFNNAENKTAQIRCRLGDASTAFLAPEQCWLSKTPQPGRESTAMDVWGVGALIFTLLFGRTPFHGANNQELQENICWTTMQFPIDTPVSKEAKSLMFQILTNKDPRTRMSMTEVREHPWFSEQTPITSSARHSLSDRTISYGDASPLLAFSQNEISSAVQTARVRVTAKKKKVAHRSNHVQV